MEENIVLDLSNFSATALVFTTMSQGCGVAKTSHDDGGLWGRVQAEIFSFVCGRF